MISTQSYQFSCYRNFNTCILHEPIAYYKHIYNFTHGRLYLYLNKLFNKVKYPYSTVKQKKNLAYLYFSSKASATINSFQRTYIFRKTTIKHCYYLMTTTPGYNGVYAQARKYISFDF